MTSELAYECLLSHGIKPSVQRLAVMDYLLLHRTHPTVDEIHTALAPKIPTLSKTTVYNTLKLLVEQGAAKMLTISERFVNFDADLTAHAHFLCTTCGKLHDVCIDEKQLKKCAAPPDDFEAASSELYFRGTCRNCKEEKARANAE